MPFFVFKYYTLDKMNVAQQGSCFYYLLDFTGQLHITVDISRFTVTVGRFHDLQKFISTDFWRMLF